MNPFENPFSRRVWKAWARSGFKVPRKPLAAKQENEQADGELHPLISLGILAILFICLCLALAGFWYLLNHY